MTFASFRMGSFSAADDVISFTVSNYDAGSYFSAFGYRLLLDIYLK